MVHNSIITPPQTFSQIFLFKLQFSKFLNSFILDYFILSAPANETSNTIIINAIIIFLILFSLQFFLVEYSKLLLNQINYNNVL